MPGGSSSRWRKWRCHGNCLVKSYGPSTACACPSRPVDKKTMKPATRTDEVSPRLAPKAVQRAKFVQHRDDGAKMLLCRTWKGLANAPSGRQHRENAGDNHLPT